MRLKGLPRVGANHTHSHHSRCGGVRCDGVGCCLPGRAFLAQLHRPDDTRTRLARAAAEALPLGADCVEGVDRHWLPDDRRALEAEPDEMELRQTGD